LEDLEQALGSQLVQNAHYKDQHRQHSQGFQGFQDFSHGSFSFADGFSGLADLQATFGCRTASLESLQLAYGTTYV
jgi:hypothetical protein